MALQNYQKPLNKIKNHLFLPILIITWTNKVLAYLAKVDESRASTVAFR